MKILSIHGMIILTVEEMTNEKRVENNIFISYHSSKVELAAHVSKYMKNHGIDAWYAEKSIRSGEQWDEAIHAAIKNCCAVVLLFCSSADASIQVQKACFLAQSGARGA